LTYDGKWINPAWLNQCVQPRRLRANGFRKERLPPLKSYEPWLAAKYLLRCSPQCAHGCLKKTWPVVCTAGQAYQFEKQLSRGDEHGVDDVNDTIGATDVGRDYLGTIDSDAMCAVDM
jgi:hypothetical protein